MSATKNSPLFVNVFGRRLRVSDIKAYYSVSTYDSNGEHTRLRVVTNKESYSIECGSHKELEKTIESLDSILL